MRDARITSTIAGMSRPKRIAATIALASQNIPDDAWAEILNVPFDMAEP